MFGKAKRHPQEKVEILRVDEETLTNVYLYQQNILYNRPKFFAIAFVLLSLQLKYIPLAVKTQC